MSLQNSALMHNMIPEFSIISCYIHSLHVRVHEILQVQMSRTHTYFAPVFSLLETVPGTVGTYCQQCEMSERADEGRISALLLR